MKFVFVCEFIGMQKIIFIYNLLHLKIKVPTINKLKGPTNNQLMKYFIVGI